MKTTGENTIKFESREEVDILLSSINLYQNTQEDLGESKNEKLAEMKELLNRIRINSLDTTEKLIERSKILSDEMQ